MSGERILDESDFWAAYDRMRSDLGRMGTEFQHLEDENTMLRADIVKLRIERGDYRGDYDEPPNPATVAADVPTADDLADLP